jgi:hypothetical protein
MEPVRTDDTETTATSDAAPRTARQSAYLWQLWPGRNWPAVAAEEAALIDELRRRGDGPARFERADATAVLNALRCGLDADDLLERAPGLRPWRLVAAWDHLEAARQRAVAAWEVIAEERSLNAIVDWAAAAAPLLEAPVRSMLQTSGIRGEDVVASRAERAVARVAAVTEQAAELEERLARCEPGDPVGVEIGRMLYDPYRPGVWSDPYFLPPRVGTLTPNRVADLLGERHG